MLFMMNGKSCFASGTGEVKAACLAQKAQTRAARRTRGKGVLRGKKTAKKLCEGARREKKDALCPLVFLTSGGKIARENTKNAKRGEGEGGKKKPKVQKDAAQRGEESQKKEKERKKKVGFKVNLKGLFHSLFSPFSF